MRLGSPQVLTAVLAAAALCAGAPSAAAATRACSAPTPPGGDWPAYGHDASNTSSQPAEHDLTPARAPTLAPRWVFSTKSAGDGSALYNVPVVAGGCVFVGSASGVAYGIDAANGKVAWKRQLDAPNPNIGGALYGAPVVHGRAVIFLVNETSAPYAVALDRSTGAVIWRSAPVVTTPGDYTNSSAVVAGGVVIMGYSEDETVSKTSGGVALLDAATGSVLKVTPTIPPADEAKGYGGGGIWATAAYDPGARYAYVGAANPSSRKLEHPNTNAILKIDLDRRRATFGEIVAAYKGNVDSYTQALETASQTPVCEASDQPGIAYPTDDPACGQLDLDFGAAPNLFSDSQGRLLVGELQKSGVYHAADAGTMQPAWASLVGASCTACNAASTAFDGSSIIGVFTPGGVMASLARDDGAVAWRSPIGDLIHYQTTSTAAGVAYTVDSGGNFDAYDASSGSPLLRRPLAVDTGAPMIEVTGGGATIAGHTVFVTDMTSTNEGYLVAYQPSG